MWRYKKQYLSSYMIAQVEFQGLIFFSFLLINYGFLKSIDKNSDPKPCGQND